MNNIWMKCLALADRVMGVSVHYRRVFNNETMKDDAERVIYDLAKFCGAMEMDISLSNGDIASGEMARKIGRLEVYQHITKMLRMSEQEKNALAQRLYQYEQSNQKEGI